MQIKGFFTLSLFLIIALQFLGCEKNKSIQYVDNARLFRETKFFISAKDSIQNFNQVWQKNAQPLKDSVDLFMKGLQKSGSGISDAEKTRLEKEFRERQETFQKFVDANQKKAQELEKNLSESAIKQVNAILQRYREEKGYGIIFGTTSGGNILAADKSFDITDDVIKYVNAEKQ